MSCKFCFEGTPEEVWAHRGEWASLDTLVDESHYGVSLSQCQCGQRFAEVFCEAIDWVGGNDPQAWVIAPISAEEMARLKIDPNVAALSPRKWLDRYFPSDGELDVAFHDGPIILMPHD